MPGDLSAGLLVAALAVPQSLGYAAVAGVPVQVGLYTLPPALLAYALLGSSRLLFMGPVSTVSVLSGSIVRQLAGGDPVLAVRLTSALAIVAGLVLLAAGLLRVGWVARFLSVPIVTGFVTGLVVLIVVGEIPGLLGLPPPPGALLERLLALARDLPDIEATTFAVAASALILLFAGQRWAPRVPWALVVLVGGIVVSRLADLPARSVPTVGDVPTGLPRPWLPWVGVEHLGGLVVGGIAVAAVGIAEGLAAARTFAHAKESLDDDTELVANGAADVAAGVFGGLGVAGSLSKTAANARAGAHTQISGVASAVVVLLVLLFAAGLIGPLPRSVLSAIVINAVWGLVQPSAFRRFRTVRRNDFVASLVALVGVPLLGPLNGLLVAIGQSLLGLVYRSMQVEVDVMGKVPHEKAAYGAIAHDPCRETVPGVLVLRPDGPIFWANADPVFTRIGQLLAEHPDTRVLILDLEATNQLDTTTAERLDALLARLRVEGRDLLLVRVFGNVKALLSRCGLLDRLGEEHLWHSISAAVKAAKKAAALAAEPDEPAEDEADQIVTRPTDPT
ncbi:MAG: SulP family inorganic anion transporter [Nocardioides sp.]